MSLSGFDVSLELSRSAVNRILEAAAKARAWDFKFSEKWLNPEHDKYPGFALKYTLELTDPWTRGGEEQRERITTDWRLLSYARGDVEFGLTYQGNPLYDLRLPLQAVVEVGTNLEVMDIDGRQGLVIRLDQPRVVQLELGAVPAGTRQFVETGLSVILQDNLRAADKFVPVSVPSDLDSRLPGGVAVGGIATKSHVYLYRAADAAVGLAIKSGFGTSAPSDRNLAGLVRQDGCSDFVCSFDVRYVNAAVTAALGNSEFVIRFGEDGRPDRGGGNRVEFVAISVIDEQVQAVVSIARHGRQVLTVTGMFRLVIEGGKIRIEVTSIDTDLVGARAIFARVGLNVVYLIAKAMVSIYLRDRFNDDLAGPVEDALNRLSLDLAFSGTIPGSNVAIQGVPSRVRLSQETVSFAYDLTATPV